MKKRKTVDGNKVGTERRMMKAEKSTCGQKSKNSLAFYTVHQIENIVPIMNTALFMK